MLCKYMPAIRHKRGKNDAVIHTVNACTIVYYALSTILKLKTMQTEMSFKTVSDSIVIQSMMMTVKKLIT